MSSYFRNIKSAKKNLRSFPEVTSYVWTELLKLVFNKVFSNRFYFFLVLLSFLIVEETEGESELKSYSIQQSFSS